MREDILTVKEVAAYLKVTERTLYRLAQGGKIPAFTRIPHEDRREDGGSAGDTRTRRIPDRSMA